MGDRMTYKDIVLRTNLGLGVGLLVLSSFSAALAS